MIYGYARVSTDEQTTAEQEAVLTAAGCDAVVVEIESGAKASRPQLRRLLDQIGRGDALIVVRLDRLARSLRHLLEIVERLEKAGATLKSLHDPIDTGSAQGRLTLSIIGAMAEFERSLIRERTKAGLRAAKRRGKQPGNPKLISGSDATKSLLAMKSRAHHVDRALREMPQIMPVVRKLRPAASWQTVCRELQARQVLREDGTPWTSDALRRTVGHLVREGLIPPGEAQQIQRSSPRRSKAAQARRASLVSTVASIFNTMEPDRRTAGAIARKLTESGVLTEKGSTTWAESSVRSLLVTAQERGQIIDELPKPGRRRPSGFRS